MVLESQIEPKTRKFTEYIPSPHSLKNIVLESQIEPKICKFTEYIPSPHAFKSRKTRKK